MTEQPAEEGEAPEESAGAEDAAETETEKTGEPEDGEVSSDDKTAESEAGEAQIAETNADAGEDTEAAETRETGAVTEETGETGEEAAEGQEAGELAQEAGPEETEAEPAEDQPPVVERKILVHSSLEGVTEVAAGTEVVLTGELIGFEGVDYTLQWYCRVNGTGDFVPIEGAHDLTYVYEVNKDTYLNSYYLGASITEFTMSGE